MISFNSYQNQQPQQQPQQQAGPPPPLMNSHPTNHMIGGHNSIAGGSNKKENTFDLNKTLFLGDLSYFCTEDDIFNLFSPYGSISTIRVQRGVSGEPLLHGYVVFHSPLSARQALMETDGLAFMGRNLRVQMGTVNHHNKEKLGFSDSKNFTQIHVSFICKRSRGFVVNEQVLRDIFTPFGQIADVAIKKHSRNPKQQRQTGYGFIYFVRADDACRAVIALKNTTLHDITFDCNISHKSEHMIRSILEPADVQGPHSPNAVGNAQYSVPPPAASGGLAFNGNYSAHSRYGQNLQYSQEMEYQSRVLGPRGLPHRNSPQYGGENILNMPSFSGVPLGVNSSFFPDYHEDFQQKNYQFQGDNLISPVNNKVDAFYSPDQYSAAAHFPTAGTISHESVFEFGRDLAHFDQTSPVPAARSIPFSAPGVVNTALATTPGGLLNSQHSLTTLTSLTDGITTNATGSPKGEKQFQNSFKSSPDHLDETLLYSFQSLSLPSNKSEESYEKEAST